MGLFATSFIPKGTLIWRYNDKPGGNVASYRGYEETRQRLNQLASHEERKFFMDHIYLHDGRVNEILDDGKFWNHSETPNTGYGASLDDLDSSYAIRDIQAGEELLDDYGIYEYPEWFSQLAREYGVSQDFITIKDSAKPGFNVKYEVRMSEGKGLGLFAAQFIPRDALIWKFFPGVNVRCFDGEAEVRDHLASMATREEQVDWLTHVYLFGDKVNEIMDDGKLWNHSETPNTYSGVNGDFDSTYAKQDIQPGDELLDDYGEYQYPAWFMALCGEFGVPQDFFTIK
jgi:SET domain-containing protein